MNTVIQIRQCNRSCWLFPWLRIAAMQTGSHRLSWTAWIAGIWSALAAIRSAISTHVPRLDTLGDSISVTPTTGTLLTEVNCEDGGRMYLLAAVHCRVWASKSARNNRWYVICESVITKFYCIRYKSIHCRYQLCDMCVCLSFRCKLVEWRSNTAEW